MSLGMPTNLPWCVAEGPPQDEDAEGLEPQEPGKIAATVSSNLEPTKVWTAEQHENALRSPLVRLPRIGEPLRTRVTQAPSAPLIPDHWFQISLNPIFGTLRRTFAQVC